MQFQKIMKVIINIFCFFIAFLFFVISIVFLTESDYLSFAFMFSAAIICAIPSYRYPLKKLSQKNKIILKITLPIVFLIFSVVFSENLTRAHKKQGNDIITQDLIKDGTKKSQENSQISKFNKHKNTTLGGYKNKSIVERKNIIVDYAVSMGIKDKDLDGIRNCMGHMVFEKNKNLKAEEVLSWCYYNKNNKLEEYNNYFNELAHGDKSGIAAVMCENHIKKHLISPSTADFPFFDRNIFYRKRGTYVVQSYVDSQNNFGAIIRTNFRCKIKFSNQNGIDEGDPRGWQILEFNLY